MSNSTIFKGSLGDYTVVVTEDQSQTLYSEAFGEACHSSSGAQSETRQIYLEGCDLKTKVQSHERGQKLSILEIGLGAGIGVIETYRFLKDQKHLKARMITTEIDAGLASYILASTPFEKFSAPQCLFEDNQIKILSSHCEQFELIVLVGDARHSLSHPRVISDYAKVAAIYQDAFSPKRNPLLWSIEWFKLLREHWAQDDCILSTYSASNSIRKALLKANWCVAIAPGFGPKRQSTRATPKGGELSPELTVILERSGAEATHDPELELKLEQIAHHLI